MNSFILISAKETPLNYTYIQECFCFISVRSTPSVGNTNFLGTGSFSCLSLHKQGLYAAGEVRERVKWEPLFKWFTWVNL